MTVSIGLGIPTYGAFPGDAWSFFAELADIADAGGVETCWVPDHVTLPEDDVRANGGRARGDEPLDAWTVLAMIAARTNRLRVGTEVTPLPLRHPVLLAQTVVTLDPGRCPRCRRTLVAKYSVRPHGDHNPKHGGSFFIVSNNWHLEVTHPAASIFRLYIYDNYSKPFSPPGLTARTAAQSAEPL